MGLSWMYPYFIDYQQRTNRVIPVVILTPHREWTSVRHAYCGLFRH